MEVVSSSLRAAALADWLAAEGSGWRWLTLADERWVASSSSFVDA